MTTKNDDIVYISVKDEKFKLTNVTIIKTSVVSSVTKVFNSNQIIEGIINFEGEIIPLINFSTISLPANSIKVVIVRSDNGIFAVFGELIISTKELVEYKEINYSGYFEYE